MGKQVLVDVTLNGFETQMWLDEDDPRAKAAAAESGSAVQGKSRRPANKARSAQNKGAADAGDNG